MAQEDKVGLVFKDVFHGDKTKAQLLLSNMRGLALNFMVGQHNNSNASRIMLTNEQMMNHFEFTEEEVEEFEDPQEVGDEFPQDDVERHNFQHREKEMQKVHLAINSLKTAFRLNLSEEVKEDILVMRASWSENDDAIDIYGPEVTDFGRLSPKNLYQRFLSIYGILDRNDIKIILKNI